VNVSNVDLNLLPVFRSVYATRSVTLAGEELKMTQSAVSNALKRMRARFNDPLFVRTPHGMAPTPLAERLIVPIREGLARLDRAMDQGDAFDPGTSTRLFRLGISDIGHCVFVPRLLARARQLAPQIRLETVDLSRSDTRQGLMQGSIDVAIVGGDPLGQAFFMQPLFDETLVVVMGAQHRLAPMRHVAIQDYLDAEHVSYQPNGATGAAIQASLKRAGVLDQRKVVLTAHSSSGLFGIVAQSDLLLTLPKCLGQAMLSINPTLILCPLPFRSTPVPVRQQWHERSHYESGNRWLRQQIFAEFHDGSRHEANRTSVAQLLAGLTPANEGIDVDLELASSAPMAG